jgi:hypothetical protein
MIAATPIFALALAMQAQPAATDQTAATPIAEVEATEATETTEAETTETETTEKAAGEERMICRRTATVGSKFKKKVCGTKKHWQELSRRSQGTTDELKRRGRGLSPNGG